MEIQKSNEDPSVFNLKKVKAEDIHIVPFFAEPFDEILVSSESVGGLHLGPAKGACDREALRVRNISHVLTIELVDPSIKFDDITYMRIHARDHETEDLSVHFKACHNFIDTCRSEGKSVYIHCHQGIIIASASMMKCHFVLPSVCFTA